jgi:Fur family transcriptional regulator, ferric uptake regulator
MMIQSSEADILKRCQDRGLRITGQRRLIASVLAEAQDHPDVEELHRRAQAIEPAVSLSTVYRTVRLFQDLGIILSHDFKDHKARFELAESEHHDHFIDMRTGRVIEFRSPEIEALQAEIAARHGYRIVDHRLELYVLPIDKPQK